MYGPPTGETVPGPDSVVRAEVREASGRPWLPTEAASEGMRPTQGTQGTRRSCSQTQKVPGDGAVRCSGVPGDLGPPPESTEQSPS